MDTNESAERAVLARLFNQFPNSFVWIGGSVLQLVHQSPRASYDLDLTPIGDLLPAAEVGAAIENALRQFNALEGQTFQLTGTESGARFERFRIENAGKSAFTVDLVRLGGASLAGTRTHLISSPLGTATVLIPRDSEFLAGKLRALFLRTYPKAGDLFDIWFLHERGVRLSEIECQAIADALAFAEIDRETALARLKRFDNRSWIAALERSGVQGLTPASAVQLVSTARNLLDEVFR